MDAGFVAMFGLAVLGAVVDGEGVGGARRSGRQLAAGRCRSESQGPTGGGSAGAVDGRTGAGRLERVDGGQSRGLVLVVARRRPRSGCGCWRRGSPPCSIGRFRPLDQARSGWRWRHVGAVFEADDLVGAGRATGFLRVANGVRASGAGRRGSPRADRPGAGGRIPRRRRPRPSAGGGGGLPGGRPVASARRLGGERHPGARPRCSAAAALLAGRPARGRSSGAARLSAP